MKKLLSILGSVAIASSISAPVVSCAYSEKSAVNQEAEFYSLVSAQAFKSAILNDQNLLINNQHTSIDYNYGSDYYGSQKIANVFSSMFSPDQAAGVTDTDPVYMLYNTLFGYYQNGYNISDSFNDLKTHSGVSAGVKENTNLWKLVNGQESSIGVKPDSNTANLISAASGAAQTVFGNDFSSSMASTAISMLASTTIENALNTSDILGVFKNIDQILTQNQKGISSIVSAITQQNINKNVSLDQQLRNSTQQLFQGLIYIISKNSYIYTGDVTKSADVFWNFIINGKTDSLTPTTQSTENLLTSISQIIPFAMTLIHYFRAFDSAKLPDRSIQDGNLLFDSKLSNAQYKKTILSQPYVDKSDKYWYWDKDNHYMKLNLQNLFSDLRYYFSPVGIDGHQTLRAISILIGGTDNGSTDPALNPIVDTAISPLLKLAQTKVDGLLDSISSIPLVGGYVPQLKDAFAKILGSASSQLFEWFSTDGSYKGGTTIIKSLLETFRSVVLTVQNIIKSNNLDPEHKLFGDYENIWAIVCSVSDYLNSFNGSQFITNPWKTFYSGRMLYSIANTSYFTNSTNDKIRELAYGLSKLIDLKTILSGLHGDQLLENIGHIIGTQIKLPDWLYGVKGLTISQLIKDISTIYDTDGYKTVEDNNSFSLNTEAIGDIAASIIPNVNNDPDNILIVGKDGKTPVSPIMPMYYSIVYYNSVTTLTGDKDFGTYKIKLPGSDSFIPLATSQPGDSNPDNMKRNVNPDALNYLFGISKAEDGTTSFAKGSLFYAISRLYGHNYADHKDYTDMANGAESIFTLFSKFGDFAESSITKLVKDNYYEYFDPKNWIVRNIRQINLDNDSSQWDMVQKIDYDIVFKNPYDKKSYVYHVMMTRAPYTGNGKWILNQLLLQN